MRSRRNFCKVLSPVVLVGITSLLLTGCSGSQENSRDAVYDDMKTTFEQSGLLSANIGIFSKTEKEGSISYGECGSGVIFKKDGGTYCALTAAHVVSTENAQLLVFTANTEMKSENIPGMNFNVLASEVYDSMYAAEVEHISTRGDIAVIRFSAEEIWRSCPSLKMIRKKTTGSCASAIPKMNGLQYPMARSPRALRHSVN